MRKPNIRQKMRVLNSLIVPKIQKGDALRFLTSILLQNIAPKKIEEWTLWETLKNFRKKISQSRKGRGSFRVPKKSRRGTLLLWNRFGFHVRGFGCAQNQVRSTFGKSAHSAQKDHSEWH